MVDHEAVEREEEQMRLLRWLADATAWRLTVGPMTRAEGEQTIATVRERILTLFPDKAHVFDLVLRPRFERLLQEHLEEEYWRRLKG